MSNDSVKTYHAVRRRFNVQLWTKLFGYVTGEGSSYWNVPKLWDSLELRSECSGLESIITGVMPPINAPFA
jgi:hypothetical protein